MKKLLVALLLVAACVMPVSAANYASIPNYNTPGSSTVTPTTPETPVVVAPEITVDSTATVLPTESVVASFKENETVTVKVAPEAATVEGEVLLSIAGTDKTLVIETEEFSVEVNGANITTAIDLNLNMEVTTTAGLLKIAPVQKGSFYTTVKVTVPASAVPAGVTAENAVVVYVDDNGKRTDAGKPVFNADGSLSIEISHASHYEIVKASDAQLTGTTTTGSTTTSPETGDSSMLFFGLGIMLIAGMAVVVLNKKANA